MNNRHLSNAIDNVKSNFESIIDELVQEIETLETEKDKMQDEIDALKERISELENA